MYLNIGLVKRYNEYGESYMLFIKNSMKLTFFYEDPIGEENLESISDMDLEKSLHFCDALQSTSSLIDYCVLIRLEKSKR